MRRSSQGRLEETPNSDRPGIDQANVGDRYRSGGTTARPAMPFRHTVRARWRRLNSRGPCTALGATVNATEQSTGV